MQYVTCTYILYGLANINVNHNTENQQLKVDLAKVRQIICTSYTIIWCFVFIHVFCALKSGAVVGFKCEVQQCRIDAEWVF